MMMIDWSELLHDTATGSPIETGSQPRLASLKRRLAVESLKRKLVEPLNDNPCGKFLDLDHYDALTRLWMENTVADTDLQREMLMQSWRGLYYDQNASNCGNFSEDNDENLSVQYAEHDTKTRNGSVENNFDFFCPILSSSSIVCHEGFDEDETLLKHTTSTFMSIEHCPQKSLKVAHSSSPENIFDFPVINQGLDFDDASFVDDPAFFLSLPTSDHGHNVYTSSYTAADVDRFDVTMGNCETMRHSQFHKRSKIE